MPQLQNYRAFAGLHWETGSVRNALDHAGARAPHTGRPYSEALLMGVSGGAVMGYFSFAYKGYEPHAVILTRNTFDPMDTMLSRLGIVQTVRQSARAEKGVANLVDTLVDGSPAIVWADMYSLPYNALPLDSGMWSMMPIVVYGYEADADTVWIADRARVPLTVTTGELATARGRVAKDKHRLLVVDHPDPEKLPAAVQAGIWDCIKLYTEAPPKGARSNFGLAAFQHWAKLLVDPKPRMSWAKQFAAPGGLLAGLISVFNHVAIFGKDGNAERLLFADFLDEAAIILRRPALAEVGHYFREAGRSWDALGQALLPDDVAPLGQTRTLLLRRHHLFLERGCEALPEIQQIDAQLATLKRSMIADFPLGESAVAALLGDVRDNVLAIHDIEAGAVAALRDAMA